MYSQFFGNYLLNEKLVTSEELLFALQELKSKQAKLGALAVHFGYMTPSQVEELHIIQTHEDKMFGEIALEKKYLTKEQIDELINYQKPTYLLLGEVLIEEELLTIEEFENALEKYKNAYAITDKDLSDKINPNKYSSLIQKFYSASQTNHANFYIQYISQLLTNIIRFTGKDFAPQEPRIYDTYHAQYSVKQNIIGAHHAFTAIDAPKEAFIGFACRYSSLELNELDEYAKASVEDFLNLHNGLFAVNMSNEQSLELTLEAPFYSSDFNYSVNHTIYCIPIQFTFGIVNFLFSDLTE